MDIETIAAWGFMVAGLLSYSAVMHECISPRPVRRMKKGLPPFNDGQYYLDFMKEYL